MYKGQGRAATVLFPVMANAAGIDADTYEIANVASSLQGQLLNNGTVDGSRVFNVTSYMNLVSQGLDPEEDSTLPLIHLPEPTRPY